MNVKHKCEQCKVVGHKEGYCNVFKNNKKKQKQNIKQNVFNKKTKSGNFETKTISVVNRIHLKRKFISVQINNTMVKLQLDTASDITIISESTFKKMNVNNVTEVTNTAKSATGKLPLSSQFVCNVKFRDRLAMVTCYVTPIEDLNILGLDWMDALKLYDFTINNLCNIVKAKTRGSVCNINDKISLLKSSFSEVFDGKFGLCTKSKAHLTVKANQEPIFRPKRPVAYAVQHLVEELQRLQNTGVISQVNYSEWAAPIVVIKKANGSIRICAGFSTGLNNALEPHQYPLPLPEDIFSKLANNKYFSHIDLSDAFLQIEVDDESKHLLTINTHMGLFRYNRMVFGVKTFPAIFQQIMDKMLAGIQNVAAYIDDIFVSGKDETEHNNNLHEVLRRIQDYNFKIKFEKCEFFSTEVRYLGYVINKQGLKPDPDRISAIQKMPEPQNISELRSFLGAINFYSKFVNNMRALRGPLDELLKTDVKWHWSETHRKCFFKTKRNFVFKFTISSL